MGMGMGDQIYHPGGHQILLCNDSGIYAFRVEQVPEPMLAVNVADSR